MLYPWLSHAPPLTDLRPPPQKEQPEQATESKAHTPRNPTFALQLEESGEARKTKVYTLPSHTSFCSRIVISDWGRAIRKGPQPSRLRKLPAIVTTTAAGSQRPGAALPSFLPRCLTHTRPLTLRVRLALSIDPYA